MTADESTAADQANPSSHPIDAPYAAGVPPPNPPAHHLNEPPIDVPEAAGIAPPNPPDHLNDNPQNEPAANADDPAANADDPAANADNQDGESHQDDDNSEDDDLEDDAGAAVQLALPTIQMMEGEVLMPADRRRFHLNPGKKHLFIFVHSPIA